MERVIYDRMAALDAQHWWYRSRRAILAKLIERRIAPPAHARILEIGCGTGHNLAMLGRFGQVDAIEVDPAARAVAVERLGREVGSTPLPALVGIPASHYDLVAVLDVIEHIEDDRAALASIAARLRPGGRILITVPAHPWMWSAHDVVNHHFRRYTAATLHDAITGPGLRLDFISPFNSLLFPVAAAARLIGKLTGREGSDDAMPPAPVNTILEYIFGLERYAIGRAPFPPGVSLAAIASVAT